MNYPRFVCTDTFLGGAGNGDQGDVHRGAFSKHEPLGLQDGVSPADGEIAGCSLSRVTC